ncbi:hypothetical protein [Streptomyces sp. NPDC090445]|uniref:hypothetical protein n=1 Tax=Streptomyces sp. NPDC090445 TaxID=3365963 RepID=UPI0037F43A48
MQFVHRADYGLPATSPAAYIANTEGTKVHYLGSPYSSRPHDRCDDYVREIRASHLANEEENYVDIAYSLLVCEHGRGPAAGRAGSSGAGGGRAVVDRAHSDR